MYRKEIQKIIKELGYEYVEDLHNGLSNLIVKIKKDNKFFVLKYYPKDYFKKDREVEFIELAKNILDVPRVLESGKDFFIMAFKDGMSAASTFSKKENKSLSRKIGEQIGEATKRLHDHKLDSEFVGFLTKDKLSGKEYKIEESKFENSSGLLKGLINEQIEELKKYQVDIPDFSDLEIDIKNDVEKCLLHHDICPKNILFVDNKISTFVDFEYAMVGSRLFDIAKAYVLGIYLPYHTLGTAKYLNFSEYMDGFYNAYGRRFDFVELKPFFVYVLLNYTLFWLSSDLLKEEDKNKILPIHLNNLQRLKNNQEIVVPDYV